MKIQFFISQKKRESDGYSEITLRIQPVINGKRVNSRAKSGVFIDKAYFSRESGIKSLSRKYANTPEVLYHKEAISRLEDLTRYLERAFNKFDKETLTSTWLQFVVNGYYSPETYKKMRTRSLIFLSCWINTRLL